MNQSVATKKVVSRIFQTNSISRRFVIVDNEQIGKQLIERGRLERRTNFIPLNKIQGHPIQPQILDRAAKIAGGRNLVWRAIDLIEFDEVVRPAMEWVFGGVFVCANPDVAKRVCFDKSIMKACVTLEGDNYNPAGVLSGGARQDRGSLLSQVTDLTKMEAQLTEKQNRLAEVSHQLGAMMNNFRKYQVGARNVHLGTGLCINADTISLIG